MGGMLGGQGVGGRQMYDTSDPASEMYGQALPGQQDIDNTQPEEGQSVFNDQNIGVFGQFFGDMANMGARSSELKTEEAILGRNISTQKKLGRIAYKRARRQARKATGTYANAVGASGVQMSGSALAALGEHMREGEKDAAFAKFQHDDAAHGLKLQKMQKKMQREVETGSGAKLMAAGKMLGGLKLA